MLLALGVIRCQDVGFEVEALGQIMLFVVQGPGFRYLDWVGSLFKLPRGREVCTEGERSQ